MGRGSPSRRAVASGTAGAIDPAAIRALVRAIPHTVPYERVAARLDPSTLLSRLEELLVELSDPRYLAMLRDGERYADLSDADFNRLVTDVRAAERRLRDLTRVLCEDIASFTDVPRAFYIEDQAVPRRKQVRARNAAARQRAAAAQAQRAQSKLTGPLGTLADLITGTLSVPDRLPLSDIPFCSAGREPIFPQFEMVERNDIYERGLRMGYERSRDRLWSARSPIRRPRDVGELRDLCGLDLRFTFDEDWYLHKGRILTRGSARTGRQRELEKVFIPLDLLAQRVVAFTQRGAKRARP